MKRIITLVFLLAAAAAPAFSQTAAGKSEQAVRQLERERVEAMLRGDAAFIERNYADDYLTTSAEGLVRGRSEVAADYRSGALRYESMTHDDVRVRLYGSTAVVTGFDTVRGRDRGQDVSGRRRFTRVWVKQGGRWRLVSNHVTRLTQQ